MRSISSHVDDFGGESLDGHGAVELTRVPYVGQRDCRSTLERKRRSVRAIDQRSRCRQRSNFHPADVAVPPRPCRQHVGAQPRPRPSHEFPRRETYRRKAARASWAAEPGRELAWVIRIEETERLRNASGLPERAAHPQRAEPSTGWVGQTDPRWSRSTTSVSRLSEHKPTMPEPCRPTIGYRQKQTPGLDVECRQTASK